MRKWIVSLVVLGLAGVVHAADQSILGTQIQIKDPKPGVDASKRTVVVQAKEKASPNGIVGNPATSGASLTIFTHGTQPVTQRYALPAGSWKALKGGFKYADPKLVSGPVKTLQVKAAKQVFQLKATASGKKLGIAVVPPNLGTEACVRFAIAGGDRYDVLFPASPLATIAKNDAKTFAVKKVLTEGSCLPFCGLIDGPDCFPSIDPSASHHTYVVSAIDVPTNGSEAATLGFDLDHKANDGVDNQLGAVFGSFGALIPTLDLQAVFDDMIDRGTLVLLVDVKTTALTDAGGVGMQIYAGTTSMTPPACLDGSDTVCRQQFGGTGQFNVDPNGPSNAALTGVLDGGAFFGGAATTTLRLTLAGNVVDLPLHGVRAQVTGLTASGWPALGSKLGGAITTTDLNAVLLPVIGNLVRTTFDDACDVGGTPPSCGCDASSLGAAFGNLFDKAPTQDCTISDAEVTTVMGGFLTPDIDLDGDEINDALSIGCGFAAVAGTFAVP